jgi:hypothetical protein
VTPGGSADPPGSWEWAVCGASVTGSEHQRRGLGCDDAYCYGVAEDFVVAAVADGAGSVSGTSAWGSHVACQSVLVNAMRARFVSEFQSSSPDEASALLRTLFDRATDHVTAQAQAFGLPVARLSTTLCIALADRDRVVFGQIGDGIIAVESHGRIETLLTEAKDEYANATWFLQSDNAFEESYRTATRHEVSSFALSTDGMSYKISNVATGEPYEPFFRGSWQHVRDGVNSANFTSLLRSIEDDQTGDDKTMVLATLRWEDDEFHPSPRPSRKTMVSSAKPPGPLPGAQPAEPAANEPSTPATPSEVNAPGEQQAPAAAPRSGGPTVRVLEGSAPKIVRGDPGAEQLTDPLLVSPAAKRKRWGRRTK